MAISDKVRWKRLVNEIRYLHNESDLIEEISNDSATDFYEFYLNFAAKNGLDVQKLNEENGPRVAAAYGTQADDDDTFLPISGSDVSALVPYKNPNKSSAAAPNNYETTKDDSEVHESFNKLFKKLALKLHPDKMYGNVTIEQGMENLKLFKEAKCALEEKRYFFLLDLADKYGITQSRNYKQQNRWMKRKISNLKEEVAHSKTTYNYLFSECETEEEKQTLVKKFIAQLFGIILP